MLCPTSKRAVRSTLRLTRNYVSAGNGTGSINSPLYYALTFLHTEPTNWVYILAFASVSIATRDWVVTQSVLCLCTKKKNSASFYWNMRQKCEDMLALKLLFRFQFDWVWKEMLNVRLGQLFTLWSLADAHNFIFLSCCEQEMQEQVSKYKLY